MALREDLQAVRRALRKFSPVVVDVPPVIREVLLRRYLRMSLSNGWIAPVPYLFLTLAIGYELPLGPRLFVWLIFVSICLTRVWLGRRLMRRLETGDTRSDRLYDLLVIVGSSFWGFGPLLLQLGQVSEANLFVAVYAGIVVIALTSIGYLAALPVCVVASGAGFVPVLVCLLLHRTPQASVLAAGSLICGLSLMQRIGVGHEILLSALAAQAQNESLVKELETYRSALERENASLGSSLRDASHAASRDVLTNLYNRRYLGAFAEPLAEAVKAYREEVTVCIVDIDHFKRINDAHGHPVGDEVLRFVSVLLGTRLRDFDCLARYGGEEFAIVLRRCDIGRGRRVAEALRENVANAEIETEVGTVAVTISIGVAQWAVGEGLDQVVQRADQALYRAKQSGRDRVEIDGSDALRTMAGGGDSTFPANLH